jgi:hypothetical protein
LEIAESNAMSTYIAPESIELSKGRLPKEKRGAAKAAEHSPENSVCHINLLWIFFILLT